MTGESAFAYGAIASYRINKRFVLSGVISYSTGYCCEAEYNFNNPSYGDFHIFKAFVNLGRFESDVILSFTLTGISMFLQASSIRLFQVKVNTITTSYQTRKIPCAGEMANST